MKEYRRRGRINVVICPGCGARLNVQDSADARRRSRLRAKGLCTTCGTRKIWPGYSSCEHCLKRGREQSKRRWQQEKKRRQDELLGAKQCNT